VESDPSTALGMTTNGVFLKELPPRVILKERSD
jgi:hypothetical protein